MPVTNYTWDPVGDNLLEEESAGKRTLYTSQPELFGSVISQTTESGGTEDTHFYHSDVMRSTRELTDSNEAVTGTYVDDSWGESIATTGTGQTPFRWLGSSGYYRDSGLHWYYVHGEYYAPSTAVRLGRTASAASAIQKPSPETKRNLIWTCETAKMQLQDLRRLWEKEGFGLSVELLDMFLNKSGGTKSTPSDLSKHCALLTGDMRFRSEFHLWSYEKVPSDICKAGKGSVDLDDVIPGPNLKPYIFQIEWLQAIESLKDIQDGMLDDLEDIQYAVGTGNIGIRDARIDISSKKRSCYATCCDGVLKATVILRDQFAFWDQLYRKLSSVDYSAGAFLQKHCDYPVPNWKMECPIERDYSQCESSR